MTSYILMEESPDLAKDYAADNKKYQYRAGCDLVDRLDIPAGAHCLDVGCGTGELALHIAAITEGKGKVVGIDPGRSRIDVARSSLKALNREREQQGKSKLDVHFHVGNAETLTDLYPGETFDIVTLNSVLHWVKDQQRGLNECYAVLRKNGFLGVSGGSGSHFNMQTIKAQLLSEEPYKQFPHENMANMPTKDELGELLTKSGFTASTLTHTSVTQSFANYDKFERFLRSSSSNKYFTLDHLPEGLQSSAAQELEKRNKDLDKGGGINIDVTLVVAVAIKP